MEILPFLLAPFVASLILHRGFTLFWACMWSSVGSFLWTWPLPKSRLSALPSPSSPAWTRMDAPRIGSAWRSRSWRRNLCFRSLQQRPHSPGSFIGIAYAVASAYRILLMSKAPANQAPQGHSSSATSFGFLARVRKTLALGAIGVFHLFFAKDFWPSR